MERQKSKQAKNHTIESNSCPCLSSFCAERRGSERFSLKNTIITGASILAGVGLVNLALLPEAGDNPIAIVINFIIGTFTGGFIGFGTKEIIADILHPNIQKNP